MTIWNVCSLWKWKSVISYSTFLPLSLIPSYSPSFPVVASSNLSIYSFLSACLIASSYPSLPPSLSPFLIPFLFLLCFYFLFMQLPYIIGLQYFGLVCQALSSWDGSSWPPAGISDDAIFNGFWWKGVIDKIDDE